VVSYTINSVQGGLSLLLFWGVFLWVCFSLLEAEACLERTGKSQCLRQSICVVFAYVRKLYF
jgi:hypothetical protein